MAEGCCPVTERFMLETSVKEALRRRKATFGFGAFGEAVYYRTYSRLKPDGSQEHWPDTVIRVIEGVFSLRKDHYLRHGLAWEDARWQEYAAEMAERMFEMHWLPPGRGLWAMGTEFVYQRGSAALNNCGAVDTGDLIAAADWLMDMLMCGVGVGFNTAWKGAEVRRPSGEAKRFVIPDSREGWVASVRLLLESYLRGGPRYSFDYSLIRPAGAPIKGFGGTAAGPEPLRKLHATLAEILERYGAGEIDTTRCTVDVMNAIGECVVAGNIRRSAEMALGSLDDPTFLELKDYKKHPEREEIGWISNNTVVLKTGEDFEKLSRIVSHILENGEPGILNLINVQRYARYGDLSPDRAWLSNPCAEIPLESFELCNLSEVFPTRCGDEKAFLRALEFATFYASTVTLHPTHRPETNAVVARNRRIGVSISGIADLLDRRGAAALTRLLRKGYAHVRHLNRHWAEEAGVPASLRVTTVKPSGTISQLAGVSSGMNFPPYRYAIRRMRVGSETKIAALLKEAGVPHEPDRYSDNTTVFEFPIDQGKTREAASVSTWEQFALLAMLQREWSDNMVSCTISFDPEKEGPQLEQMLALFAPVIKSASLLPRRPGGSYPQMPYERISESEYRRRVAQMPPIDWSRLSGHEGVGSRYCSDEACEL